MSIDFSALLKKEASSTNGDFAGEWEGTLGGQDVTLYATALTPADNAIVLKKYPNFNNAMDLEGMAYYIALKACDEDKKTVFNRVKDMPFLTRLPQNKVAEIFRALFNEQIEDFNGDDGVGHEDRVGN